MPKKQNTEKIIYTNGRMHGLFDHIFMNFKSTPFKKNVSKD